MENKKPQVQGELKLLKYVLEDFLELKASPQASRCASLKNFLLSSTTRQSDLYPVEGFRLAGNLVLVGRLDPRIVESVVFVSPRDGKFQVSHFSR